MREQGACGCLCLYCGAQGHRAEFCPRKGDDGGLARRRVACVACHGLQRAFFRQRVQFEMRARSRAQALLRAQLEQVAFSGGTVALQQQQRGPAAEEEDLGSRVARAAPGQRLDHVLIVAAAQAPKNAAARALREAGLLGVENFSY